MEILLVIFFLWLSFKFLGLAFRMAWCVAKVAASVLFALAVPLLLLCLVFAGGIVLMLPLAMIGLAVGLLKACV